MSDESIQEVSMQPDSGSELSSDDESTQIADAIMRYYYYNDIGENMNNLSVDSDPDDDDDESISSSLSDSCQTSPQPFDSSDDTEDDSEDSESENNVIIQEIGVENNDNLVVDNPLWYAQIRHFLTEREREDLWKKTPWVLKWFWDDSDDNSPMSDHPLFKDEDSVGLF
ncbi:uncharacterized protein LOC125076271 [Vanessa atalanta]|uniref:uncharacterized protein LOC125076271 n=1 Tax=Vanessa atalanta TaxID=42275 RepID=UPI001FCCEA95|nr:uncharacterized protein LOC125076271 [Vanessa atalanta]